MEAVCGHHSNKYMGEDQRRSDLVNQYEYMRHAVTKRAHSHGRCFTRAAVLRQIAERMKPFLFEGSADGTTVRDDEIFIDFSCGANEFAPMLFGMKTMSFDVFPPENADNFLQKSWYEITPTSCTCVKCNEHFTRKPLPTEGLNLVPAKGTKPRHRSKQNPEQWCTGRVQLDVPQHATSVIGINPPFGPAKRFINGAIAFKPRLLVLIIPYVYGVSVWRIARRCSGAPLPRVSLSLSHTHV